MIRTFFMSFFISIIQPSFIFSLSVCLSLCLSIHLISPFLNSLFLVNIYVFLSCISLFDVNFCLCLSQPVAFFFTFHHAVRVHTSLTLLFSCPFSSLLATFLCTTENILMLHTETQCLALSLIFFNACHFLSRFCCQWYKDGSSQRSV